MVEKLTDNSGRVFSIFEKRTLKYVDAKKNANKFWQAALARLDNPRTVIEKAKPWVVLISWGRVGTVGQKMEKAFTADHKALAYMEQRYRDKERKGYAPADEPAHEVNTEAKAGLSSFVYTEWDLL